MSLDLDKIEQRAVINFLTLEGVRPLEIEDRMKNVYGDSAPSIRTVRKWSILFRRGRLSLEDDSRSGCPSTVVVPDNITIIEKIVTEDPRIKVDEIEKRLDISHGSIISILHDRLGMIKKCSKWIPKSLSQEQMRQRLEISERTLSLINEDPERLKIISDETWISLYDPESRSECMEWHHVGSPPSKRVRQKSAKKVMATVFWDKDGIILLDFLPPQTTLNGEYYANLLCQLRVSVKQKRRGLLARSPLLLEDNARPHICKLARDAGRSAGFTYLEHPPYSPDLAPSDYFLFSHLKKHLRGTRFESIEEAKSAVMDYFSAQPTTFYRTGIVRLKTNLEKCIEVRGDYFV